MTDTTTTTKETTMEPTYSVTVQHPDGYERTIRHVSLKKLVQLFRLLTEEETQNPTADEITCNGKFGCE